MNQSVSAQSLILRHKPEGERHPYIPLPYERSPRRPIAGQAVTLGVETGHHPSASAIWCTWRVEGKAEVNRTDAKICTPGENADQWQITLPAFEAYDVVHYRLYARNAGGQVESEEFSFCVLAWVDAVSILAFETDEQQATALLQTTRPGLLIQLRIEPGEDGTLALQLSSVKDARDYSARTGQPLMADLEGIRLIFQDNPFRLEVLRKQDSLLLASAGALKLLVDAHGTILKYRMGFESPADEAFYGFGERFNALDQRGRSLDNYVYGQYTNQGNRTYIPVPFFISSRGYGVWLQTERQAEFDMAASEPDRWIISGCPEDGDASLEIKFFFQASLHAIIQAFTGLTGRPKLPPDWVFGLWMSSNDWNSQAEVLRQLHKTQELKIPASVVVIEAWSDEINFYIWNEAHYQQKDSSQAYRLSDFVFPGKGLWPDLKAMTDEIHRAGLRLVLWQNPCIKQAEPREHLDDTLNQADQEYAVQHDYVVKKADGSPHRAEEHMPWFKKSLVLDFTNPEAAEWWLKKREYLVTELGVDGFKTDGGEHIWDIDTRFFNGMRGSRGINHYPVAYEAAYRRFMQGLRGDDFVLFSRAGYTGAQLNPCHWAGDENSTWDAFRATLRALLNVGICGLPFVGWDIAGFAGPLPTSELYLRAAAFSIFCPIMQYHSDVNFRRLPSRDRTPWNMQEQTGDAAVIPVFRSFANLRMNLLPYILTQAYDSSQNGLPLMRSLALEYPADRVCRKYPYEYLFGEALLVAPVVEEGVTTWPVYLPEGDWRELWSGELYHGPVEINVSVPRDRIPVFQKQGSLIALNLDQSGELCSPVGNSTRELHQLTLRITPGGNFESNIIHPAIAAPARVVVESLEKDGALSVQLPMLPEGVDLVIYGGEPASVTINGEGLPRVQTIDSAKSSAGWQWHADRQEIRVHLPELRQAARLVITG